VAVGMPAVAIEAGQRRVLWVMGIIGRHRPAGSRWVRSGP
jgi:hypothetical protein